MPRRPAARKQGRPFLLTPETEKALLEATEKGLAVVVAAQLAGVSGTSFQRWLTLGHAEVVARDAGEERDPEADVYVEFYGKVMKARATAAMAAVDALKQGMTGGYVTRKTERKYRDADGNLVTETTEEVTAPDWRAGAHYLERQHPKHYGRREQLEVEVTGADGGPVQHVLVDAGEVAAKVRKNIAALTAGSAAVAAVEGDQVVDAELVDADG